MTICAYFVSYMAVSHHNEPIMLSLNVMFVVAVGINQPTPA